MNNLEFAEFQKKYGYGNEVKKRECKNIHSNKTKTFTLSDWKKNSEHYIKSYIYDIGTGKFVNIGKLNEELNIDND